MSPSTAATPAHVPAKRELPPSASSAPAKRDRATAAPAEEALQVVLLSEHATAPARGSPLAAGFDLAAAAACVVPPRGRAVVKTGLQVRVPAGCYGRVAPRSGLAVKKGIDVGAGVVDADYRGEVGVVLFNFGEEEFKVSVGDRVAQLVLEKISTVGVQLVEKLDETERGAGGFGSTGVEKSQ